MSQAENLMTINDPDEHKIQLELVKLIMGVRYDKPAKLLLDAFENITLSSGLSVETREEILRGDTGWQRNLCQNLITSTLKGIIPPGERTSQGLIKEIMRGATVTLSVQNTDHQSGGIIKPDVRFNTKGGVVVFDHDNFITHELLKYTYLVLVKSSSGMVDSIDAEKYSNQRLSFIGVDTVRVQFFSGIGIDIQQKSDQHNPAHTAKLTTDADTRIVTGLIRSLAHDIEKYGTN